MDIYVVVVLCGVVVIFSRLNNSALLCPGLWQLKVSEVLLIGPRLRKPRRQSTLENNLSVMLCLIFLWSDQEGKPLKYTILSWLCSPSVVCIPKLLSKFPRCCLCSHSDSGDNCQDRAVMHTGGDYTLYISEQGCSLTRACVCTCSGHRLKVQPPNIFCFVDKLIRFYSLLNLF